MTTQEVLDLKYKVENPFLRKWSMRYGIVNCMTNVRRCLESGFGYMGPQRIDRDFINTLSHADRIIYSGVLAWYDRNKLNK